MDLFEKLSTEVAASIAKFLLQATLGDVGEVVGKPVVDVLKEHYQDRLTDARAVKEAGGSSPRSPTRSASTSSRNTTAACC